MQPCQPNSRSFFEKLQSAEGLDLRDKRGKRHDLAVVLVGVTLAVLSNRDGCLSGIQRHLANHYNQLVACLGVEKLRPVSRQQLPRILEKVSVSVLDNLIFSHFGVRLNEKEQKWLALDGKELRGSIESGDKRGQVVVQAVSHASGQTVAHNYYCGQKESEVPTVRELLEKHSLASAKVSLDALHCKPKTLEMRAQAKGKYVVGLKENQKQLLKAVRQTSEHQTSLWETQENNKEHGRIESRK